MVQQWINDSIFILLFCSLNGIAEPENMTNVRIIKPCIVKAKGVIYRKMQKYKQCTKEKKKKKKFSMRTKE